MYAAAKMLETVCFSVSWFVIHQYSVVSQCRTPHPRPAGAVQAATAKRKTKRRDPLQLHPHRTQQPDKNTHSESTGCVMVHMTSTHSFWLQLFDNTVTTRKASKQATLSATDDMLSLPWDGHELKEEKEEEEQGAPSKWQIQEVCPLTIYTQPPSLYLT